MRTLSHNNSIAKEISEESYQSEGAQRPTSNIIDEGVADENSRCNSIGNAAADHPNNVQESTKLRLVPSRVSQRITRQSSRLFSSFKRKKSNNVNLSNHSSLPIPKNDHFPTATPPNLHNSDHNAKLTEI